MKETTKARVLGLLVYAAKCVTSTVSIFFISTYVHYLEVGWALISSLLVLSPDGKDAVSLAVARIKANLLGAAVGLLFLLVGPGHVWMLCAAIVTTLSFCYLFRLDTGARSALAATVIVTMHQEGKHLWDTATQRVIAVLVGCIFGLLITFLFHFRLPKEKTPVAPDQKHE